MYLFSVFLGGPIAAGRMGEDHEVVFVVASDPDEAKRLARSKWRGLGRAHIDAVQRIDQVDGYRLTLTPNLGEDRRPERARELQLIPGPFGLIPGPGG